MPWHQNNTNTGGALTQAQIEDNAYEMLGFFTDQGWSYACIAGMFGNIESEGVFNPAQWQIGKIVGDWYGPDTGYGMYQFTPPYKYHPNYTSTHGININDAASNGIGQCQWVIDTPSQWSSAARMNQFFAEEDPGEAAKIWMLHWERPGDQSQAAQEYRASRGEWWYEWIAGHPYHKGPPAWLLFKMSQNWRRMILK